MAQDKTLQKAYTLQLESLSVLGFGNPSVQFISSSHRTSVMPLNEDSATAIVLYLEAKYKINRPES